MDTGQTIKESQVSLSLKNLQSSSSDVFELLKNLESRLDGVLLPPEPTTTLVQEKSTEPVCMLAVDLRNLTAQNRELEDKLKSIVRRLEL